MPGPWIKRDWCSGMQNIRELARRYFVSEEAMTTRLSELGLTPMTLGTRSDCARRALRMRVLTAEQDGCVIYLRVSSTGQVNKAH